MKDKYEHFILDVCQKLHMEHTGASDALSKSEEHVLVEWLRRRLEVWNPDFSRPYDRCVLNLVRETLQEREFLNSSPN